MVIEIRGAGEQDKIVTMELLSPSSLLWGSGGLRTKQAVFPGGAGVPWQPQILVDQLTLCQPRGGGADYAHQIILAPLDFQTF